MRVEELVLSTHVRSGLELWPSASIGARIELRYNHLASYVKVDQRLATLELRLRL